MTRHFLWVLPALAAAMGVVLCSPDQATAQSVEETAVDASADAAADTAVAADTAADANESPEQEATAAADAEPSTTSDATDAAANADVAVDSAATDAAASTDVQGSTTQDVGATDPVQPTDAAAAIDANANADAAIGVDATTQPGVNATTQGAVGAEAARRGVRPQADVGLQFGRVTDRGLTVNSIDRQSYFYNGGLQRGDVIVSYNGRPIRTHDDWRRWVVYQPGQRVPVIVLRDGRQETIYVTYRVQQQPGVYVEQPATYPRAAAQAYLGIALDRSIPDAAVVQSVNPGSPAEQAGLQPGDIIVAINGRGVSTWRDVPMIVSTMQAGDLLDITFTRRMENRAQATLGIRNVDAPVAVGVQATYSEPPAPATVDRAYRAAPGVEVRGVPQPVRPRDFDADGRVLERDRINDEPGLDRLENDRPGLDRDGGLRRLD